MKTADSIISMLRLVQAQRAQLKERDAALAVREEVLISWLAEERAIPQQQQLPMEDGDENPLNHFLLAALAGGKEFTAAELGNMAQQEGLIDRNAFPGRVVHGALLGMQRRELVVKDELLGKWGTAK